MSFIYLYLTFVDSQPEKKPDLITFWKKYSSLDPDIYLWYFLEILFKLRCYIDYKKIGKKNDCGGLPWWSSGWESACQCRGHGFEPWSGKIPRAVEQLGPWATITEPARLEPVLRNKRGRDGGRPAHRDEEWPPFARTLESPRTETKTQHSHKWINK